MLARMAPPLAMARNITSRPSTVESTPAATKSPMAARIDRPWHGGQRARAAPCQPQRERSPPSAGSRERRHCRRAVPGPGGAARDGDAAQRIKRG